MILTQYTVRVFFLLELPTPFFQRVPGAYIRLLYRAYKKTARRVCPRSQSQCMWWQWAYYSSRSGGQLYFLNRTVSCIVAMCKVAD